MSITRFGEDSDVYVYWTERQGKDVLICCGCKLHRERDDPFFSEPLEMIEHLKEHIEAGHLVPEYALQYEEYADSSNQE